MRGTGALCLLAWLCGSPLEAQKTPEADAMFQRGSEAAKRRTGEGYRVAAATFDSAAQLAEPRAPMKAALFRVLAAQMYLSLGRTDLAGPRADAAVLVLRRDPKASGAWLPQGLTAAGEARSSLGQPNQALALFREGLDATLKLPASDASDAKRKRQLEGTLRSDIGSTLAELGSLDSAATQLQLALAARADAVDLRGTGYTLNNMGRLQQTLGRPDSARRLFASADAIFAAENDAVGRAIALTNTGFSYERERRPADAVQWHRRALQALGNAGNPIIEAVALNNLGRNYLMLDSLVAARDDMTAGLQAALRVDDRWRAGWNLADLGRVELASGRRDSAIVLLSQGHTALDASDDPIRAAETLLYLGRAYALPGPGQSYPAALDAMAAANQVRQGVGRRVPRDADRVSFAEQDLALTDEWATTTLAWGGQSPDEAARAALAVSEQGRARSLLLLMHGVDSTAPGRNELPTIGQRYLSEIFATAP